MRKVIASAAVVTMSVGMLTACSGGGDYCGELKSYGEAAKKADPTEVEGIDKMLAESRKISKSAPDDLKDDWKVIIDYAEKLRAAKDKGDQAGKGELEELSKNSEKVGEASAAIGKHGKDTCKVTIDGF